MDVRVVWLSGIVLGVAAAASSGCDAPDPGEVTFSERSRSESPGSSGGTSSGVAASGGGSSTSSGGTDDGGSSSGGPEAGKPDPVFGTTTFAAGAPGQNANGADGAHGGTVEGKNCIVDGCHLAGAKPWGFGGTVYTAATGGATVKNAEVRVTGPDGTAIGSVYTDDNGNFWYAGARPPANSRVGVRDGTKKNVMTGTIAGDTGAACNAAGCHNNTMRIFLK